MEIVTVTVGSNREFCGLFTTKKAAEASVRLSYSNTKRVIVVEDLGPYHTRITVGQENRSEAEVFDLKLEPVHDRAEHL